MNNDKLGNLISIRRVLGNNQKLKKNYSKRKKDTKLQNYVLAKDIDLEFAYNSAQECIQKFIGSREYNLTPSIDDKKELRPRAHTSTPVKENPETIGLLPRIKDKNWLQKDKLKLLPNLMQTKTPRKFKIWRRENGRINAHFDECVRRLFQVKRLQPIKRDRQNSVPGKKHLSFKDPKSWMSRSDDSGIFRLSASKAISKVVID